VKIQKLDQAHLKAVGFTDGHCKYETILTDQIYLRTLNITTSLSKYLQGFCVNCIAVFQMVNQTLNSLKNILTLNNNFTRVKQAAENVVR